jgi:vancomycin resistance protein YoaR
MWAKVYRDLVLDPYKRQASVALLIVAGALLGLFLSPEKEVLATSDVQVLVAGRPVDLLINPRELAAKLAKTYLSEKVVIRANDERVEVQRSQLGVQVDVDRLANLLEQARNPKSPLRRVHAQTIPTYPLDLPVPAQLDAAQAISVVAQLKDRIDFQPVDARVDPAQQKVLPSKTGARLDLYGTLEAIDQSLSDWQEEVNAPVQQVAPKRNISFYKDVDISVLLSEFDTKYDRSFESTDRTHNLKTAASAINGYVVQPNQIFDFNQIVGRRTKSNGFREAKVIADGQVTEGQGGGTCQIASTLHAAVFFAGLPIVTRHPHSRPSFYIKLGLDAAVADPTLNFVFQNDLPFPIVLGVTVDEGIVHAEVRGARQTRTVVFDRHIEAVFAYKKTVINDPALPSGVRVLTQRGIPGFRVARSRDITDSATQKNVHQETKDNYPITNEIWRIGTGPEVKHGFELPKNDSHPEYLVDEFLTVTRLPGVSELNIKRDPGVTGRFGWTSREDFFDRAEEAKN